MTMSIDLIERLFKTCTAHMIRTDGARELLLPMLRVAAEHANVGAEETRRMTMQYAYPEPKDPAKDISPPGRRMSAASAALATLAVNGSPEASPPADRAPAGGAAVSAVESTPPTKRTGARE